MPHEEQNLRNMKLSVKNWLGGRTVLLTGSTGFIGSVILEQLLRLVNVKSVYLLIRGKQGVPASARLQQLLASPLYHLLQQQAADAGVNLLDKLHALEGDISTPELGLDSVQLSLLRSQVDVVIHCAADIALNPGIQTTLRHNHISTRNLLHLARQMENLRCFVHMSTFGVSYHLPWNGLATEQICPLPLELHGQLVDHQQFVQQVMSLPPKEADAAVRPLLERLGYRSTSYAFVKHLTEQLVDEWDLGPGVSKVIVRPSMVTATTAEPHPGYLAGYAGLISYVMAYAVGLFPSQQCVGWSGELLLDLVPCDVVASLTLAAACAGVEAATADAAGTRAVVYHATSSHNRLLSTHRLHQLMSAFWSANPLPYALATDRYIVTSPSHQPDARAVEQARQQLAAEVQQHCQKLISGGRSAEATMVKQSFAAYGIVNSTHYNRSIVCCVDNVRALAARLTGQDKQQFQILWEPSAQDIEEYMHVVQTAVRQQMLMMVETRQGQKHNQGDRQPLTDPMQWHAAAGIEQPQLRPKL